MSVSCDPQDLMTASKCMRCIPPGMRDDVIIYLLCQIAEAGSASQSCLVCIGAATEPVADATCDCSIAYNDKNQFWFWDSVTAQWNPVSL